MIDTPALNTVVASHMRCCVPSLSGCCSSYQIRTHEGSLQRGERTFVPRPYSNVLLCLLIISSDLVIQTSRGMYDIWTGCKVFVERPRPITTPAIRQDAKPRIIPSVRPACAVARHITSNLGGWYIIRLRAVYISRSESKSATHKHPHAVDFNPSINFAFDDIAQSAACTG